MASFDLVPVFHGDYMMAYPAPVTLRSPSESSAVAPAKVNPTPSNPSRSPPTIQYMPSDVLYYIFKMGVDNENAGGKFSIRVSQVCSHWRRVALACPLLWTKVHISSAHARTLMQSGGEVLPWASAFAERSASCPLDIKLVLKRVETTPVEMRDILLMHVHLIISTAVEFLACVHDRVRSLDVVTDFKEVTFLMSYKVVPRGLPLQVIAPSTSTQILMLLVSEDDRHTTPNSERSVNCYRVCAIFRCPKSSLIGAPGALRV